MTGVELVVPDPRNQPVPVGWFESAALPVIASTNDWDELDEYEARLRAFASYIDSFDGDSVEFEKALRLIEKRRGELAGEVKPGERTDLNAHVKVPSDVSAMTLSRWRKLARHWDELWPTIRDTRNRSDVTQAALLKRIDMGAHYSSDTDEWATPASLFAQLDAEFGFEVDVCALPGNAKCSRYFSPEDDGLEQEWEGVCWMNPPYGSEIPRWIEKAHASGDAGATVVCLVPARTDTAWWWKHCRYGEVRFLRGRLKFGESENSAPFPSAVVIFGREPNILDAHWER